VSYVVVFRYRAYSGMPNAAVERRRAALSSAQQAHNGLARLLRARDDGSPSAPTACYAPHAEELSFHSRSAKSHVKSARMQE
jgi:hypothetical protein